MISHTHRLVFVHVPKCAGMSVESCLGGLPTSQRAEQHFTGHEYRRLYPEVWQRYHRFALVRHPVARCWSYVRFYRRFDPVWRRHLSQVSDAQLLSDLLMSSNLLTHRSCDAMLTGDEEVLKVEDLSESWAPFAARHGLPEELPQVNRSPSVSRASDPPAHLQLMIEALFPQDYDRFGYPRSGLEVADLPEEQQGPVWWARLRALTLEVASAPTPPPFDQVREQLQTWVDALPADAWRHTWHQATQALPAPTSPEALVEWAEDVHDEVNRRLGKPQWDRWRR